MTKNKILTEHYFWMDLNYRKGVILLFCIVLAYALLPILGIVLMIVLMGVYLIKPLLSSCKISISNGDLKAEYTFKAFRKNNGVLIIHKDQIAKIKIYWDAGSQLLITFKDNTYLAFSLSSKITVENLSRINRILSDVYGTKNRTTQWWVGAPSLSELKSSKHQCENTRSE